MHGNMTRKYCVWLRIFCLHFIALSSSVYRAVLQCAAILYERFWPLYFIRIEWLAHTFLISGPTFIYRRKDDGESLRVAQVELNVDLWELLW